jgi:anti-anti-sigma regulatory factor
VSNYLRVTAAVRDGLCELRITGELDARAAETFAGRARAAVRAVPGPLVIDLSGVTGLDVWGAHALTQFARTLARTRLIGVTSCPPCVSRTLKLAGFPPLRHWVGRQDAPAGASELVHRVEAALSEATDTFLAARATRGRRADVRIRAASTRERAALIREQARQVRQVRARR